ncbi:MAG: hypothetical protein QGG87_00430 [Nitrospinota bacterium]|nr:hypothetical protein [Nitrospinota bacterium]
MNNPTEITDDFGRFLISRNVVNVEMVRKAINLQKSKAILIGELAIQEGILSIDQVFNILEKRLEEQKFFCQIAVELGYLTKAIAHKLLELQKKRLPPLGDMLLEMKAINQYDLERELRFFKEIDKDND